MVYVRSRKFCCCLPVRFGVFVMTLCGAALGGLGVAGSAILIKQMKDENRLKGRDAIITYISAAMYLILALTSLFGFIGVFTKRLGLIRQYCTIITIYAGFFLGTGIFQIYTLYAKRSDDIVKDCIGDNTTDSVEDKIRQALCRGGTTAGKATVVGIFVITFLWIAYGVFIVSQYVSQLKEEDSLEEVSAASKHLLQRSSEANYAPIPMASSQYGERHDDSYAFTAPTNAHGYKA